MKTVVRTRLYNSMSNLALKLKNGSSVKSEDYQKLCLQFNYLFLNRNKNGQTFILDEKGLNTINDLLDILNKHDMQIPERYTAHIDHSFFYFHLLKSWIHFTKANVDKATKSLEIAKTFPQQTETDDLKSLANQQLEIQQLAQEHKQMPEVIVLPSDNLNESVKKYLETNKAELLLQSSEETLARYFIDPEDQAKKTNPITSWNQREPGSVSAMINMIRSIFNKDNTLTLAFIKEMHKLALKDVSLPPMGNACLPGEFNTVRVGFDISAYFGATLEGFYDITDWVEKQKGNYRIKEVFENLGICLMVCAKPEYIEEKLCDLIRDFHTDIKAAKTTREAIKACSTFSHYFALIHPFTDGNLRLSQQLLNFLLGKYGLPLCILPDPVLIEGTSPDELVDIIITEGFHNFQHLMKEGYVPGTCVEFDSKEIGSTSSLGTQSIFKTPKIKMPSTQETFNPSGSI